MKLFEQTSQTNGFIVLHEVNCPSVAPLKEPGQSLEPKNKL